MADPVNAQRLFDGKYLRCTVFGTGPGIFVTFDNFVIGKADFAECSASAKVIAAGFRQIVIQTARNDWYLNDELEPLLSALGKVANADGPTKALGFSMGAFGALIIARALRVDELILVSPRFPQPMGWTGAAKINCSAALLAPDWQDRLSAAACAVPDSVVLFDPRHFDDRMAARWLERASPKVRTVGVAFGGHPCTKYINLSGNFGHLQQILLEQPPRYAGIFKLKKAARAKSVAYLSRVADYLEDRKTRGAAIK